MSDRLRLVVTGMTCGGCENAVTRALLNTSGVESVVASHRDKYVEVTFEPDRVLPAALRETIEALGYTVAP